MATRPPKPEAPRSAYHHGNLRDALIASAIELIEENGVDKLSVREAAKRAGVSPGAPFRHFATRTALLTAVAEQATRRLRTAVDDAVAAAARQPPLQRFAAIGHAYLAWANTHPTHFRVISERALVDYESSPSLAADNEAIRRLMQELLAEAFGTGMDEVDRAHAQVAARALVYGLARMAIDGHFPEWNPGRASSSTTMGRTLDFFIGLLGAAGPRQAQARRRPGRPLSER